MKTTTPTAAQLAIARGDQVRVTKPNGSVEMAVVTDPPVKIGDLWYVYLKWPGNIRSIANLDNCSPVKGVKQ